MIPIFSLLIVITLSLLITRVATIMLAYTGLSTESARFQARSALTNAGFTTHESERVVGHPVRRRIISALIMVGSAGVVGAISTLLLAFLGTESTTPIWMRILVLLIGIGVLWLVASSQWVDRQLSALVTAALKRYTQLDVVDYASLMHLSGDYRIAEIFIEPEDWLANRTLGQARLREEGIVVLGVERVNGSYLGVPHGETQIFPNDTLIVYGRLAAIQELDVRKRDLRGELEHTDAVAEHVKQVVQETAEDIKSTVVSKEHDR